MIEGARVLTKPDFYLKARFNMQSSVPYEGALIFIFSRVSTEGAFGEKTCLILDTGLENEKGERMLVPAHTDLPPEDFLGLCSRLQAINAVLDITPTGFKRIDRYYFIYGNFDDFTPD
jgi:hypothetical protein